MVDDGTNLENVEAITRAITRRVSERAARARRRARAETATEKELTVAKLSLLHAQVEPHFLYNTLASAQVLTRSDPARADQMLGHLITYLRQSLPRADDALSTLGEELERARAYLEILQIRMGERLATADPGARRRSKSVPLPPMMLQTLVENAIKHGLEPVPGGGTIWILAREAGDKVVGHGGRRRPRLHRGRRRHGHRPEERARAPAARVWRRGVVLDRGQLPQGRGGDDHRARAPARAARRP